MSMNEARIVDALERIAKAAERLAKSSDDANVELEKISEYVIAINNNIYRANR